MPNAVTAFKLQDVEETVFVTEVFVAHHNGSKLIPKTKNEIQKTSEQMKNDNDYYPFRLYQYL
jgi:hypothetical protein